MLTLIFYFILTIVILLPLIRYGAFFLSNYLSGDLPEVREKSGPLFFPVLRGIVTAMAAEGLALFGSLYAFSPAQERKEAGIPVVLVHGLYHNRTAWRIFERRLRQAGVTNIHTYQYNSFTKTFEPAVVGLLRKLDTLIDSNPDAKVVLVGHSLGGLVSRCVAGNPQYRDHIAGLVTLGSPHKGSDLAWIGGNRMARDLIPGRHIAQSVERSPDPDCPRLSIYTLTDDYVFPLSMLRTSRSGWQEKVCAPMGHIWMLYSREVTKMVRDFLKEIAGPKK